MNYDMAVHEQERGLNSPTFEAISQTGGAEGVDDQILERVGSNIDDKLNLGLAMASVGLVLLVAGIAARNPGGYNPDFEEAEKQRKLEEQRRLS
jgi:hypothetical protein